MKYEFKGNNCNNEKKGSTQIKIIVIFMKLKFYSSFYL
jgi:hypothetical protein